MLLWMVRESRRAERRRVDGSAVLSFVCLGKMVLNQKLMLELLVGAGLLVRGGKTARSLRVPGRGCMRLRIAGGRVAHGLLSTSACGRGGQPWSLRGLPDAMLHGGHVGWDHVPVRLAVVQVRLTGCIDKGIDRGTGRRRSGERGLLVMVWIGIHAKAGVRVTKGARGGLPIGIEGHDWRKAADACTSDVRPKWTLLGGKTGEAVKATVLRFTRSEEIEPQAELWLVSSRLC